MIPKSFRIWFFLIWGICVLLGFSLFIYNYGIVGTRYKNFINSHAPEDIQRIEFYSIDNSRVGILIRTIDDDETVEKISKYLSEAIAYFPNHPIYIKETYVVFYMDNSNKFEFVFQLMEKPDETVYIDFVGKNRSSTSYYGNVMIIDSSFLPFLESLGVLK